jgi:hypothetical protein
LQNKLVRKLLEGELNIHIFFFSVSGVLICEPLEEMFVDEELIWVVLELLRVVL